jgi:hypothetical protein
LIIDPSRSLSITPANRPKIAGRFTVLAPISEAMGINSQNLTFVTWAGAFAEFRRAAFGNLAWGCCSAVFGPQAVRGEHDKSS